VDRQDSGTEASGLPVLPAAVTGILQGVPLMAIDWPLRRMVASFARRHGSVFARLGPYATRRFLIDPLDLPFAFCLHPRAPAPRIAVLRKPVSCRSDARIAGPLSALLGMLHGMLDGDALFFSRDLVVEGDIEAVLALRNALDDVDVDLAAEAMAALGPLAPPVAPLVRRTLLEASRLTGVALTRPGR